ncbi:hypothetical protein Tco_0335028 [Tanacetum coccineum]
MADLPPPDHVANLPKDEPVHPEPAPIILHHAPAQPEGYVGDDDMEDDEEEDPNEDPEEEPIEQLVTEPNNMDGFALHPLPQPEGNMNEWLIEDDDDKLEEDGVDDDDEDEMEIDENDEENGGNDDEDDVKVHAPGPMRCNLESVHRGVKRLDRQMFDMYNTEIIMVKKFKEDDIHMNRHEYDITALHAAVRKNSSDYSKMMKFVEGLSKQFNEFKEQSRRAERLSRWEAWVRERIPEGLRFQEEPSKPPIHPAFAPRSDDPYVMVRDAAIAAQDDDGDDTTAPTDSQSSKPRGSPRDPQ